MIQGSHVWKMPPADAGKALEHFKAKLELETDAWDLHEDLKAGVPGLVVVDARKAAAYEGGHIPGAINLYHRDMDEKRTAGWSKNDLYVVYCVSVGCNASSKGCLNLAALGFQVKELLDGLHAWEDHGYPVALGKEAGKLP